MKKVIFGAVLSVASVLSANLVAAENREIIDGREYLVYDDMLVPYIPYSTMSAIDLTLDKWTNGEVFYAFDVAVTAENRQRFVEATQVWSDIAQVSFSERTDQANYIYITNSNKNTATVGMAGGRQTFTMSEWGNKYVIVHELGHTLGSWHEQQRSDRDNYVTIHMENVQDGQSHNFNIHSTANYSTYDFLSVMHYDSRALSTNGQMTIEPKPEFVEYIPYMGIRSSISGGDQLSMAMHYGAKNIVIPDVNFKSYLVANFDANGDGEIDSAEAISVNEIHTPGNGLINNLQGVEHFRALSVLDASDENIATSITVPNSLRQLDLSNNQLDVIDSHWVFPPLLSQMILTGNPIDEYACENLEFIKNSITGGNVTYSPVADGSELICNAESAFILINEKVKLDRRSKGPQTYQITVADNATNFVIDTTNFSNLEAGEMDVYVAYSRQPTITDYDYFSNNAGNVEHIEVTQATAGTWYILLNPIDRSFEEVNLVASYSIDTVIRGNELANDAIITGLNANVGESLSYYINVPAGASELSFVMSGGSGDADLYVRYADEPTSSLYDCRPWLNGNEESCVISNVQAGRYYVSLQAYTTFTEVSLLASYREAGTGNNGGSLVENNLSANTGEWLDFAIEVPQGMASLQVDINGGTGDADLYINKSVRPSTSTYLCRPYKNGNLESCTITAPESGTWYISVNAYKGFSALTLNAVWNP